MGPAFGFMAGSAFIQIYIDAPWIRPDGITVNDDSWLGAWWLGMVIFGVAACLPAIPVLLFPRRLPVRSVDDPNVSEEGLQSMPTTANTTAVS